MEEELFTDRSKIFADSVSMKNNAKKFLLGVPFDSNSMGAPGQRFAPLRIRNAMETLEPWDMETQTNPFEGLYDLGDIYGTTNYEELEKMIKETLNNINKFILSFGGDHSISLALVKTVLEKHPDINIISFDAHTDSRNEYLGAKIHASTVMKRIADLVGKERVLIVGARQPIKNETLNYMPINEINEEKLKEFGKKCYVSIDMDVLDPCYAPGTSVPVPLGMTIEKLLHYLKLVNPVAADIVEVNPLVDRNNLTSLSAGFIGMKLLGRF